MFVACVLTLGQQVPILKEKGGEAGEGHDILALKLPPDFHFSQTQFPLMTGRHSIRDFSEKNFCFLRRFPPPLF